MILFESSSEARELVLEEWARQDSRGWTLLEPEEAPGVQVVGFITDLTGHTLSNRQERPLRMARVAAHKAFHHCVGEHGDDLPLGDQAWTVRSGGHPQVRVSEVEVDSGVRDLLQTLWAMDIGTRFSCEGGPQVESITLPHWWRAWRDEQVLAYPFPVWVREAYLTVEPADFVRTYKYLRDHVHLTSVEASRSTFRWRWHGDLQAYSP